MRHFPISLIICLLNVSYLVPNTETGDHHGKSEETGINPGSEEVPPPGYILQAEMQGCEPLIGKDFTAIHEYMRSLGWDYSEHPNSSDKDHKGGVHCEVIYDEVLKQYVFKFISHASPEALDGDRGKMEDRQRNEMKSQTSASWHKMNGNRDERQILEWKFFIPEGFQPSSDFCHIHQLKAQEGSNNGSPLITITPRSDPDGGNKRIQVIHTGDVRATSKGVIIDSLPLSDFEDQWIQVRTEMHYTHHGKFAIRMTRISDGKVLVDKEFQDIDLWREGTVNIRNKYGIYRSFGRRMEGKHDRPANGIKDEILLLGDFRIYEADTDKESLPHN